MSSNTSRTNAWKEYWRHSNDGSFTIAEAGCRRDSNQGRERACRGKFMKFEVYCDENRPDLFSSQKPQAQYMVIGSLWLRTRDRGVYKTEMHRLRDKYKVGGEFKWQKVSPSRIKFYVALVDWFLEKGDSLRFRCIAVDREKVDLIRFHDSDQELGFYKFYYQMLHHWIADFNEYAVFCDFKVNRRRDRLHALQRCLNYSNLSARITTLQAVRSRESVLLELCDVLTGAAASKLNAGPRRGSAKSQLVARLEQRLGREIAHTSRGEPKFNVFVIDLGGGW